MAGKGEVAQSYRASGLAAAPGLIVAVCLWLYTFRGLGYPQFVESQYNLVWQSLGRDILLQDPVGGILSLHTQPPGLNILEALDLYVSPDSHLMLGLAFLAMVLLSLFMIVDTLNLCGLPWRASAIAGVCFAVLPATVIYSFYPFSTTPTMFGTALAVWGIARMRLQPLVGIAASSLGALTLFITRSSFAWPFVLCWLIALSVVVWRSARPRGARGLQLGVLATVLIAVIAIQGHYLLTFGIPTLTSWTGENLAKALTSSGRLTVTPQAEAAIRKDPCEAALLDSLTRQNRPIWNPSAFRAIPACAAIPPLESRGTSAWDSPDKAGADNAGLSQNFNWSERLVASRVWNSVMQKIVMDRPVQLVAMAIGSPTGARDSSLGIYMGPSEDYTFVTEIRSHYPLPDVGGILSLFFAPVMLLLGLLGLVTSLVRRQWHCDYAKTLYFGSGLVLFHIAASTLFEHGENMRFQAETTPAYIVIGFLGCFALLVGQKRSSGDTAPADYSV